MASFTSIIAIISVGIVVIAAAGSFSSASAAAAAAVLPPAVDDVSVGECKTLDPNNNIQSCLAQLDATFWNYIVNASILLYPSTEMYDVMCVIYNEQRLLVAFENVYPVPIPNEGVLAYAVASMYNGDDKPSLLLTLVSNVTKMTDSSTVHSCLHLSAVGGDNSSVNLFCWTIDDFNVDVRRRHEKQMFAFKKHYAPKKVRSRLHPSLNRVFYEAYGKSFEK